MLDTTATYSGTASSSLPKGTIATLVTQHLRSQPRGTEVSTAVLADLLGHPSAGFSKFLMSSVRYGDLSRRIASGSGGGQIAMWSLGANFDASKPPAIQLDEMESTRVQRVSAAAVSSVFALANERGAAPFSCALSTDGRLTIERFGRLIVELTNVERQMVVAAAAQGVHP